MTEPRRTAIASLRATFFRGIGIIIPLALTFWLFREMLNWVDGILSPVLEQWIGQKIPGLGFISVLLIIMLVGLLTRNLVGKLLFAWFEDVLLRIPLVRSVYGAIKDLVGAFAMGGKSKTFRQVIMFEYPRAGLYCIGFVTNEMSYVGPEGEVKEFFNVYIPNPPNPTSGFLSLVPKEEAIQLDLSVEEGLKLVLSGGIIVPGNLASKPIGSEP
ncbi:DUF502 domain-containing protein [bacterium]|nr:MAG: DUF502 domain-containing protein [bacterium]